MNKQLKLNLNDIDKLAKITKALGSEVRLEIIKLLNINSFNVNEIAENLKIAPSTVAVNIKMLEEAGLIQSELQPGVRGSMKVCSKVTDAIEIDLFLNEYKGKDNYFYVNMPIGNYYDFKVFPTCGMVSDKGYIIGEDYPKEFYTPMRHEAQLLWFHKGYVEYRFSNSLFEGTKAKGLEVSMELCSEAPNYRNNWPSDITVSINGIELGTWTSPGDLGGRRGRLNPLWWPDSNTQYGILKTWRVYKEGTYIDENKLSDVCIDSLNLENSDYISLRIEVKDDAINKGGINLFGEKFGDYEQNIVMRIDY